MMRHCASRSLTFQINALASSICIKQKSTFLIQAIPMCLYNTQDLDQSKHIYFIVKCVSWQLVSTTYSHHQANTEPY